MIYRIGLVVLRMICIHHLYAFGCTVAIRPCFIFSVINELEVTAEGLIGTAEPNHYNVMWFSLGHPRI